MSQKKRVANFQLQTVYFKRNMTEPLKSFLLMHQSIPSTNIPPGLTPGEFFKVVKFPAPGQKIFAKSRGKKNRQNPRPWEQFCGLSRQFCHDRETIRIFLVLFFSLAFFGFFSKIIKLSNTEFLSDSSIAQLRFNMYGKN